MTIQKFVLPKPKETPNIPVFNPPLKILLVFLQGQYVFRMFKSATANHASLAMRHFKQRNNKSLTPFNFR